MYQRDAMSKMQLEPEEWRRTVKKCSKDWRNMDDSERDVYHAMAAEEAGLREEAMKQPFQSAHGAACLGDAAFDAAGSLSKGASKLVSLQRLLTTYARYKSNDHWSQFDSGLANADGAMPLDAIDLTSSHQDLSSSWSSFISPARKEDDIDQRLLKSLHHSACGGLHGVCVSQPFLQLASKFSHSLHLFVMSGAQLAKGFCLTWEGSCREWAAGRLL